jgi:hypothetical protein
MTSIDRELAMIHLIIRDDAPLLTCERHPQWTSGVVVHALQHVRLAHGPDWPAVCMVRYRTGRQCGRPAGHGGAHGPVTR